MDKQYLITKGVPCKKRIKQLQSQQETKEREIEDGWVETENPMGGPASKDKPAAMDIDEMEVVDADIAEGE